MASQETISSKFSREDGILEWDFFVKCYSERPQLQYFSAPIPIDEAARLKAVKSLIDENHEIFKVEDFIGRSDISRHLSIGAHILLSSEPIIVLDTLKPRESFTMANRRKLMDFARLVMVELELMMDEKDTMSRPRPLCFLRDSKVTTPALPSKEEREAVRARLLQSMESDAEMTKRKHSTLIGRSHQDVLAATRAAQSGGYTNCRTTTLTLPGPAITRPTRPATPSSTKKALHRGNYHSSLDTASFATSIISHSLGFDLVYLLRPAFNGTIHLQALRSDGGLAYSNQNKVPKDEGCGYQTGVLLPLHREHEDFDWYEGGGGADTLSLSPLHGIVTKSPLCRRGIVLCGFTWAVGESSSFSSEKVRLFREFGKALWDTLSQREA
ncbi:hypothetical protein BGX38DRAFT_1201184 [Terfezia claveryi]|nr:hypothetical protein BGX38DRAFT_1201184 [Terfezia claveryi]